MAARFYCAGKACPGLPWRASDTPHPASCRGDAPLPMRSSFEGDLLLREMAARDLDDFAGMLAASAAEIRAIALTLPAGGVNGPRFLLQQEAVKIAGIAAGIRGGLLAGADACTAMEQGVTAFSRALVAVAR